MFRLGEIQRILGNENRETTEIYLHTYLYVTYFTYLYVLQKEWLYTCKRQTNPSFLNQPDQLRYFPR